MSVTLVWVNLAIGTVSSALILSGIVVLLVWVRGVSMRLGKVEHSLNNVRHQVETSEYLNKRQW